MGRSKEMIIRGDYNIYPTLYEERISRLSGVSRCALIGVWDPHAQDERVVLVVEPDGGASNHGQLRDAVERSLRTRDVMDHWALPDQIVVMPLIESGRSQKIDRDELRHRVAALAA